MATSRTTDAPDVDLGSIEFWGRPAEERDHYFEYLRRAPPVTRHEPPEDILGMSDQGRLHAQAALRASRERNDGRLPAAKPDGYARHYVRA